MEFATCMYESRLDSISLARTYFVRQSTHTMVPDHSGDVVQGGPIFKHLRLTSDSTLSSLLKGLHHPSRTCGIGSVWRTFD